MGKKVALLYYQEAVVAGKTIADIAKEQGIREDVIYKYMSKHGLLSEYRQRYPDERRPSQISEETRQYYEGLIKKKRTIEDIAEETGRTTANVLQAIYSAGLTALYRTNYPVRRKRHKQNNKNRTYEGLEALVEQGVSQAAIARHFDVTREMVRKLINNREGLRKKFEAARDKRKETEKEGKKQQRQILVSFLYQSVMQRAKQDPAMEKAVQYYFSRCYTPSFGSLERYYALFQAYDHARNKEKKLSVNELAKKSGVHASSVGRILKTVGEKPMYGMKDRHALTSYEKKIVQNAIRMDTQLGYREMETITGISWFVFNQTARREGIQHARARNLLYQNLNQNEKVTYKKALDLYEALDAGFSAAEARAYAGIKTDKGYAIALEKRTDLEAKVTRFKHAAGIEL